MKDLESEEQNLEISAGFDREPMELLHGWSDVLIRGSSGDDTGSWYQRGGPRLNTILIRFKKHSSLMGRWITI